MTNNRRPSGVFARLKRTLDRILARRFDSHAVMSDSIVEAQKLTETECRRLSERVELMAREIDDLRAVLGLIEARFREHAATAATTHDLRAFTTEQMEIKRVLRELTARFEEEDPG